MPKSILVGMLVLLTLGVGFGPVFFPRTVTRASTQTTYFKTTSIIFAPVGGTSALAGANEASLLYQLEFVQESNCLYSSYLFPWAVVLDNSTVVVQPSNATPPLTWSGAHLTSDGNYSTIVFAVPNGTYDYAIAPTNPFSREQSGNVTVAGSDVQVEVWAFITAMGCSSTTSTSFTTATTTVVSTSTYTSVSTTTNSTALYGVAAVAVIFIITTGYLAIMGRKPTS